MARIVLMVSWLSSSRPLKRPIRRLLLKQRVLQLGLAILFLLIVASAWAKEAYHPKAADDFPSDVASVWFDLLYDVVKNEQSSPLWPPGSMALRLSPSTRRSCLVAWSIGRS
jgi:hypothetical protein